ncbi:MAG TPA: adenylate/guanylate cyclase domain-containing protein [Gaiellaceae bacterium]
MPVCRACGRESPADFRFCGSCGAPLEDAPIDERKLATVMFVDVVGSTASASAQDPERTRARLGRFYDACREEIERIGGTVEKFIGDAVVSAFGAPVAQEDHAERALHAALAVRRRIADEFEGSLEIRIGVNTGEVVVGSAREGSSFVTGDAVNVAARLETAASPGEIVVGERTALAAGGAFELEELGRLEAKGKPDGVVARRLVRALSLMRPRGIPGLGSAFVGRESELELVEATYRRTALHGEPHLVTIMGEAGVGKTRINRELWERLAGEETPPLRRTGRCAPYGAASAYLPVAEIVKEHLGILDSDSSERIVERLGDHVALGLALGLDVAGDVHPLAARARLQADWVAFVTELAAERPVVLLFEDLHWADAELLDLVERTLADARGPILVLATARPELLERRAAWGGGRRNVSLIWLEPLAGGESELLVEQLLGSGAPDAVRPLLEQAGGNPFFVEEILGALIDGGVLERANGGWRVNEAADSSIPDSVQGVLAARIDLLAPGEKAALQAGAVIGRVFWAAPVEKLVGPAEPDFALLEQRDFIRGRPGSSLVGEREYVIKHALTREVAYGSLPTAQRARLHAGFATWLEQEAASRDQWASVVAHHYAEAVRPEDADLAWADEPEEAERLRGRAVEWLARAAALATSRYELDDAIAMLRQALVLEEDATRRSELWHAIGRATALKFDGDLFLDAMQEAIRLAPDKATEAELYGELVLQTASRSGMWPRMPVRELVDGWIERALELAAPASRARAMALIGQAMWNPYGSAESAVEGSLLAERLGDAELRSHAWDARGIAAFVAGEYDLGRAWAERRFELIGQITDPDHLADIHMAPVSGCIWSCQFNEARRLARAHDEIARKLTPHHVLHGVSVLIEVEELLGVWDEVLAMRPRLEANVAANALTPCIRNARSLLVAAIASSYGGDYAEARRLEEEAESFAFEGYGEVLDMPRARLALQRGELDRVEEFLNEPPPERGWYRGWMAMAALVARLDALATLGDRARIEEEAPRVLRPGKYLEPFGLRALGLVREDEALVERAAVRFDQLGLTWHAARTRKATAGGGL